MKLSDALTELGRPVAFYPAVARFLGGIPETLFLCQMVYWHDRTQDPEGWVWKTSDQLTEETALSYKEQKRARQRLRAMHILHERTNRLLHRTYFRIDLHELDELWCAWLNEGQPDRKKVGARARAASSKPRDVQTGRFVLCDPVQERLEPSESREARIERQRKKLAAQAAQLLAQQEVQ